MRITIFVVLVLCLAATSFCEASPPRIPCPARPCLAVFIPEICRKTTFFEHEGRKCRGCDTWIPGCMLDGPSGPDRSPIPYECPKIKCPSTIPEKCRVSKYIKGSHGVRCKVCDRRKPNCPDPLPPAPGINDCPQLECPGPFIPKKCRQEIYVTGQNGARCRVCDSRKPNCGTVSEINDCPQLECPGPFIPNKCRQENYVTGQNGARCRVCDSRKPNCGTVSEINDCPQIECPGPFIPNKCRQENYVTGQNGARCRVCDSRKPKCPPRYPQGEVVCPSLVPCAVLNVPRRCRQINYSMRTDGIRCRLCDTEKPRCTYKRGRNGD